MIKAFLDHGADIHGIVAVQEFDSDYVNQTALLQSIATRQLVKVKLLMEARARVDMPAKRGVSRTSLQAAVEHGVIDIIHYILDQGVDLNEPPAIRNGGT